VSASKAGYQKEFVEWLQKSFPDSTDAYREVWERLTYYFIARRQEDPDECASLTLLEAADSYTPEVAASYPNPLTYVRSIAPRVNSDEFRRKARRERKDQLMADLARARGKPDPDLMMDVRREFGARVDTLLDYKAARRGEEAFPERTRTEMSRLTRTMRKWMRGYLNK
jgi:hypothetical protein